MKKLLVGQQVPQAYNAIATYGKDSHGIIVADRGNHYAVWTHRLGTITHSSAVRKLQWQSAAELRDIVCYAVSMVMGREPCPNDIMADLTLDIQGTAPILGLNQ